MNVILTLTARCNAACKHCSSSCGPERTEHLGRDLLFDVMRQAAALSPTPTRFALTGGEPFLDFELLLEIVALARSLGGDSTCVTNGYWATSAERARDRLERLRSAGLAALAVSTSRFHLQFVRRRRVERALAAAREVGLDCTLKYVRARSDSESPDEVRRWALAAGARDVQDIALVPHLRHGAQLAPDEVLLGTGLPEGLCPGAALTVREDGAVLPCCSPGTESDAFILGSTRTAPLRQLKDRFDFDGRLRLLRERGPAWIAREAVAAGLGARLKPGYADVCDLCAHLGTDPVLAEFARQAGDAHEVQHMARLLSRLATP